jgi:hypothetical protein
VPTRSPRHDPAHRRPALVDPLWTATGLGAGGRSRRCGSVVGWHLGGVSSGECGDCSSTWVPDRTDLDRPSAAQVHHYGTSCKHEHVCIRLRLHLAQIIANLKDRISEARFSGGRRSEVDSAMESQQLSGYVDEAC